MQKQILERFIAKYTLGGLIEIVPWKATGQEVSVSCVPTISMVAVQLSCSEIPLPVGEYCIYETSQLRSLLNILDDTIDLNVKEYKSKPIAFTLKDGATVVDFALSDPLAMPEEKKKFHFDRITNDMWNVEFEADTKFVTAFTKSKGALNTEVFTVKTDKTGFKVIIGYAEYGNTTRVTLSPTAEIHQNFATEDGTNSLKFSANCLREILMANKETTGKVRVSDQGLMHLRYEIAPFVAEYYLQLIESE